LEKSENGQVSTPTASVIIFEVVHFIKNGEIFTKGAYKVVKALKEAEIYFNGCEPL